MYWKCTVRSKRGASPNLVNIISTSYPLEVFKKDVKLKLKFLYFNYGFILIINKYKSWKSSFIIDQGIGIFKNLNTLFNWRKWFQKLINNNWSANLWILTWFGLTFVFFLKTAALPFSERTKDGFSINYSTND